MRATPATPGSDLAVRPPWRPRIAALAAPVVMAVVAAAALMGDVLVAVLAVGLVLVCQAGRFPGLLSWLTQEFEVRSEGPVEVGLDGEALVLDPPLRFASLPGALRVRLPRTVGLAPGAHAAALTTNNLGALLRVAVGR